MAGLVLERRPVRSPVAAVTTSLVPRVALASARPLSPASSAARMLVWSVSVGRPAFAVQRRSVE
jgi:hypothetical protein